MPIPGKDPRPECPWWAPLVPEVYKVCKPVGGAIPIPPRPEHRPPQRPLQCFCVPSDQRWPSGLPEGTTTYEMKGNGRQQPMKCYCQPVSWRDAGGLPPGTTTY
ncbi:MAG: hypothetical protein LBG83_00360 [Oscillospiraceae bacterium]|nr:hypothetical protein [Oscillospiraceae bacterium]